MYRYLISRAAPSDKIWVGLRSNLWALNYYWPSPDQLQLGYRAAPEGRTNIHPRIWTVSYYDEESPAYRAYADRLGSLGYKLAVTRVISQVTIRCFEASPRDPEIQTGQQNKNEDAGTENNGQTARLYPNRKLEPANEANQREFFGMGQSRLVGTFERARMSAHSKFLLHSRQFA